MTVSRHPTDLLIRKLVSSGRAANEGEIAAIIARMASVPFSERIGIVPIGLRAARYRGQPLGDQATSLAIHFAQRTIAEGQWAGETSEEEYLDDIRQALQSAAARVVIYRARGGSIAATLTPTDAVVPIHRRGRETRPWLFVVYAADRGMIISAYQASSLTKLRIPQEALWLK